VNPQQQVSRLEALLARVQRNAAALSRERQLGVQVSAETDDVAASEASSLPVSGGLSYPSDALPESYAPDAPTLAPPSQLASATLAQPQFDDIHEETKPLWVGIQPPPAYPGPAGAGFVADPVSDSEVPPPAVSAAAPEPKDEVDEYDVRDTLEPVGSLPLAEPLEPLQSQPDFGDSPLDASLEAVDLPEPLESLDAEDIPDPLESSPPLSGERTSARAPSEAPIIEVSSLEEVLESSPPLAAPEDTSQPFISSPLRETAFDDERANRISDAPASALGGTINLPEEEAESVELELAEPPPSSTRLVTPPPAADEELEADLPRPSHRAAYDHTLSVPPEAREELAAHDQGVREARSMAPARDAEPLSTSTRRDVDSEIPAVLSARPAVPSASPVSAQQVGTQSVSAPTDKAEPTSTTEEPLVAQATVEFRPPVGAPLPEFVGEFPKPQDLSFLALLDASLTLDVSH
jgi:hypothetical protein